MDEMLSQEEINALLRGMEEDVSESTEPEISLTADEIDAIGEVSNISMGTAATTLSSLVNQKVVITTPRVSVSQWEEVTHEIDDAFVAIQIEYKLGLEGSNLLMLKEDDVKIIADLMMGGEGTAFEGELTELHLSAIGEAMNQMIGSAATSMSAMFKKKIDIAPPNSSYIENKSFVDPSELGDFVAGSFIKVAFSMQIGDLIDSEFIQIYPMAFAKGLYEAFSEGHAPKPEKPAPKQAPPQQPQQQQQAPQQGFQQPQQQSFQQPADMGMQQGMHPGMQPGMQQGMHMDMNQMSGYRNVDVQQAQFQNFSMEDVMQQKENINLIMDVPLEVTVELGRTHKSIKDILDFAPGTIIELDKLAGEPIDVLVNGKIVGKGEVVVIDENFGIRITEIIKEAYFVNR